MTEVIISSTLNLPDARELGGEAVFSLSSAKPGNGIENLRDSNFDTYWLVVIDFV